MKVQNEMCRPTEGITPPATIEKRTVESDYRKGSSKPHVRGQWRLKRFGLNRKLLSFNMYQKKTRELSDAGN